MNMLKHLNKELQRKRYNLIFSNDNIHYRFSYQYYRKCILNMLKKDG